MMGIFQEIEKEVNQVYKNDGCYLIYKVPEVILVCSLSFDNHGGYSVSYSDKALILEDIKNNILEYGLLNLEQKKVISTLLDKQGKPIEMVIDYKNFRIYKIDNKVKVRILNEKTLINILKEIRKSFEEHFDYKDTSNKLENEYKMLQEIKNELIINE